MPSEFTSPLVVEPPPDGFDFQGVRTMMNEGKLPLTVLLDADKKQLPEARMVDLLKESESEHGQELRIRTSLEPGAYGIDLSKVEPPKA